MRVSKVSGLSGLLLTAKLTSAIELDLDSEASILSAGRTIVEHIFTIYKGNETGGVPGILPDPYYWWEAGLMFDSLLNYWAVSNDTDLTDVITQGLAFQVGPDANYMPPNQSKSLGNDDQSFWANAAMTAAEVGFPEPGSDITWLQLAENVFNSQVLRWNTETCGGGLKWQIFTFNNGYNYKNSVSTLSFATLSARLARFTGNETYIDWAEKSLQWLTDIGLLSIPSTASNDTSRAAIYDGTDDTLNCTEINHIEWSQNAGLLLTSSAYAWNFTTGTRTWESYSTLGQYITNDTFATTQNDRSDSNNAQGIISEVACIPSGTCTVDQKAFRASLARGLARSRDLTWDANITRAGTVITSEHALINSILRDSAQAAAKQCTGGDSGTVCGLDWRAEEYDGSEGLGEDLSALEVILANLQTSRRYATANTTGSSNGGGIINTSGNTGNGTTGNGTTESQQDGRNSASSSSSNLSMFGLISAAMMLGAIVLFV